MKTIKTAVINEKSHEITYDEKTVKVVWTEDCKWGVEAKGKNRITITFPDSFQDRWEAEAVAKYLREGIE